MQSAFLPFRSMPPREEQTLRPADFGTTTLPMPAKSHPLAAAAAGRTAWRGGGAMPECVIRGRWTLRRRSGFLSEASICVSNRAREGIEDEEGGAPTPFIGIGNPLKKQQRFTFPPQTLFSMRRGVVLLISERMYRSSNRWLWGILGMAGSSTRRPGTRCGDRGSTTPLTTTTTKCTAVASAVKLSENIFILHCCA